MTKWRKQGTGKVKGRKKKGGRRKEWKDERTNERIGRNVMSTFKF